MEQTEVIQIERPAAPAVVAALAPLVEEATLFEVVSVTGHAEALERIKVLRSGERQIADYFEPARRAADQAKKEILAARDGLIGPIAQARTVYDRKATEYEIEERRKSEALEREMREQARKQEEERTLLAAIDAEEEGHLEEAEAILAQPVMAPVVQVAPAIAQVKGVSSRTLWSAEVHDVKACLRWMLEREEWGATLDRLKDVLETALRPLATSQHEALRIPGVRAVSEQSRATR